MVTPKKVDETKLQEQDPVLAAGVELLNKTLSIRTPTGSAEAEIVEVEPFIHTQHDSYVDKFNNRPRKPGEIMLTWSMGNPLLFLVVALENQRIVRIKTLKYGGKKLTFPGLLKELKVSKSAVQALDGQKLRNAPPEALLRLVQQSQSDEVRRQIQKVSGQGPNSLGIFTKI